jgi:hypothetical protein
MNTVVGVLVLLIAPAGPESPLSRRPPDPPSQEWMSDPTLPACLADAPAWPEDALTLEIPPLSAQDPAGPAGPAREESSFPRAISGAEIQAWREERELRSIREFSSDAFLGLPLIVPQVALESLLPRGIPVGPATYLYRTSSSSFPLVVLDQILFHEAQFLANIQMGDDDPVLSSAFTRGQKRLIRRSFFSGFRATYAVPSLTMDQVFEVAAGQGIAGYLLAPPVIGGILYFRGMDQRIRLHDDLKLRIKLAGGEDWVKGTREVDGLPAMNIEVRLWDLPLALIGSFEISSHGMIPEFLGIGTALDAVEDLLTREGTLRSSESREH